MSTVSRKFRAIVFPRLFERLVLRSSNELQPWEFESHPWLEPKLVAEASAVLAEVKHLRIVASFGNIDTLEPRQLRCPHSCRDDRREQSSRSLLKELIDDGQGSDTASVKKMKHKIALDRLFTESGSLEMMKLALKLERILLALPKNQLLSLW